MSTKKSRKRVKAATNASRLKRLHDKLQATSGTGRQNTSLPYRGLLPDQSDSFSDSDVVFETPRSDSSPQVSSPPPKRVRASALELNSTSGLPEGSVEKNPPLPHPMAAADQAGVSGEASGLGEDFLAEAYAEAALHASDPASAESLPVLSLPSADSVRNLRPTRQGSPTGRRSSAASTAVGRLSAAPSARARSAGASRPAT
jgi:hypothetical protein